MSTRPKPNGRIIAKDRPISQTGPSGSGEPPYKRQRGNPKPADDTKKAPKGAKLETDLINGEYVKKPFHKHVYRSGEGGGPEPYSKRPKLKEKRKKKEEKRDKSLRQPGKGNGEKGGGRSTVEAPPTVPGFSSTHLLDKTFFVLGGTNLRKIRDGLGLCSAGVIFLARRLR